MVDPKETLDQLSLKKPKRAINYQEYRPLKKVPNHEQIYDKSLRIILPIDGGKV